MTPFSQRIVAYCRFYHNGMAEDEDDVREPQEQGKMRIHYMFALTSYEISANDCADLADS